MSIFDGSNANKNQFAGGITFTAPTFSMSQGQINGGYSFDLPLATVAAFSDRALSFSANNTANAQGFLQGVMGNSQAHVTRVADQSFQFSTDSLNALERMAGEQQGTLRYAAKKFAERGCFITTAICEVDGKPDNCDELETLRDFRDSVLMESPVGREAVAAYYEIAPAIVKAIDAQETAKETYAYLRETFLLPAIRAVKRGEHVVAFSKYRRMVKVAKAIAGV